jgi:hypothetical protein
MSIRTLFLLLCLCLLAVILSACAGATQPKEGQASETASQTRPEEMKTTTAAESLAPGTVVVNAQNGAVYEDAARLREMRRAGGNSEISTEVSNDGTRVETRVFNGHPRLTAITVRVLADGSMSGRAYAQTGEVQPLPDSILPRVLDADPDDIADAVGFYNARAPKTQPALASAPAAPVQPITQPPDAPATRPN